MREGRSFFTPHKRTHHGRSSSSSACQRQYAAHMRRVAEIIEAETGKPIGDVPQAVLDAAGLSNVVVQLVFGPATCARKIIAVKSRSLNQSERAPHGALASHLRTITMPKAKTKAKPPEVTEPTPVEQPEPEEPLFHRREFPPAGKSTIASRSSGRGSPPCERSCRWSN